MDEAKRLELRAGRAARKDARKAVEHEATRVARARRAQKYGSHHRPYTKPDYTKPRGTAHTSRQRWSDPWWAAPDVMTSNEPTLLRNTCTAALDPDNGTYPTPARIGEPEPGHRGTGEVLSWNDKSQHMGYESRK